MRYALFSFILLISFVPAPTHAGFYGPIISDECKCASVSVENSSDMSVSSAPAYGCVLQTLQYVVRIVITIAFVIATLALIYAGFTWMTSAGNPGKVEQGKHLLVNTLLGIFIILAAWLLIDFVMKTIYNESSETSFGPWNNILAANGDSASRCLIPHQPESLATTNGLTIVSGEATPATTGGGANCPAADPATMVAIPAAATSGGTEKATPTTVRNFMAMRAAAATDGIDLKVTDGYRPESEQVSLWNQYCSSGTCGATKVAKPCTVPGGTGSNHNSGEALDISVGCGNGNGSCNTRTYNWLKTNGSRWNFRNAVPTDPVHWSPTGH
jgi:hypothetical protein